MPGKLNIKDTDLVFSIYLADWKEKKSDLDMCKPIKDGLKHGNGSTNYISLAHGQTSREDKIITKLIKT